MDKNQYFRNNIKRFYNFNKRDFYWRTHRLTPYQMMITELFLKKTKAETAEKTIIKFLRNYSTAKKLFKAKKKTLYRSIKYLGLGNQRAKALKEIARSIHKNFNDEYPTTIENMRKLPHLGMYITNAIMCFALDQRYPILDVNTSRIICRFFSINNTLDLRRNYTLQQKSWSLVPRKHVKEYNWGLLDLGALVCKTKPLCNLCHLQKHCSYHLKATKRKANSRK
jgi:A/G-specific adenine glycosylase